MPTVKAFEREPSDPDPPISSSSQPASSSQDVAPPKKTTRRHTTLYGTLSTGRTKDSLYDNPSFPSNMVTRTQAKAHLVKNSLLPVNKDPDLQDICMALLNLAEKIPGITATGAEAIRAIAIIADTQDQQTRSPQSSPPMPVFHSSKSIQTTTEEPTPDPTSDQAPRAQPHPNTLTHTDAEPCMQQLQKLIQDLQETSVHNRTSAEILSRVIDDANINFCRSARIINESAEEISAVPIALREYTHGSTPPHDNSSPYRDAVLNSSRTTPPLSKSKRNTTSQRPTYPLEDHAKANVSTKERQILIDISSDLDPNHPLITPAASKDTLVKHLQDALNATRKTGDPPTLIKALTKMRNGGIIVEFGNPEAVKWMRNPSTRSALTNVLASNIRIKDRLFSLVVSFVPICIDIENTDTLRNIEHINDLPENSVVKIRWIKDPARRKPTQRVAHAFISLSSPQVANQIIRDGICINHEKLRAHKDKKEPLRCLKCQRWGHFSKECRHQTDVCGSCAGPHRELNCNSYATFHCVNCQSDHHGSASKECPEFIRRCEELDARHPDNALPYFPTDEPDSSMPLPPRRTSEITETRPPRDPNQSANSNGTQRKLGRSAEGTLNIQNPSAPTVTPQDPHTTQRPTTNTRRYSFTLPPTPKIGPPLSPLRLPPTPPQHSAQSPISIASSSPSSPTPLDPPPPPGSYTQNEDNHSVN